MIFSTWYFGGGGDALARRPLVTPLILNIQVRACAKVYLECYTSVLSGGLDRGRLEQFYGRPVLEADRELVEQRVGKY